MSQQLRFDRYRFEVPSSRLWSDDSEVRLTPKAAAVLKLLLSRAGAPVAKDELFRAVWSGSVVSDDALTTCVQELRKALDDDAKHPRFIETRHRLGYQFIARVDAPPDSPAAPAANSLSIAVMPLTDLSPGKDQDYLCEGIAEELINALAQIDGLSVISRSASLRLRDAKADMRTIGRELGVQTLLEGSVRKLDQRLRITVQLVDLATGFNRWAQRYDRTLDDVFVIQDEIAAHVVASLRGDVLSEHEKRALRRQQTAAETYDCYLRGRQRLHRMRQPDLDESRDIFERAIALDPDYAPAWAGLAMAHAVMYEWWGGHIDDLQRAERASAVAMQLAPDLADAHVARGLALSLSRQYAQAALLFESASRINPSLFDAYYYFGRTSFASGDIERSAEMFGKAAAARPDDFQSAVLRAQSLRILGRHEEARAVNREAVERAERILALNPVDGRTLSLGAHALYDAGQLERSLEWTRRSLELYPHDASAIFNGTCLMARCGMKDEALDTLARAFEHGWGNRDWLEHDPDYDSLREDPRFKALLAKLK